VVENRIKVRRMAYEDRRIIFVYNADSHLLAQLKDYVHKIVAPDTYPCSLCQITFGNLGMKRAWRRFVRELPAEVVFLHRDELIGPYAHLLEHALPAAFLEEDGKVSLLIAAEVLDRTPDVPALQALVQEQLANKAKSALAASTVPVA
jgi:hypothetical protein